jgi:hypothetical protein
MSLGLWVPPSLAPAPELVCRVPGCQSDSGSGPKRFPADQFEQFRRHVKACSKRNFGEIERQLARREETYFTKSGDPERYAHIRAGGS